MAIYTNVHTHKLHMYFIYIYQEFTKINICTCFLLSLIMFKGFREKKSVSVLSS